MLRRRAYCQTPMLENLEPRRLFAVYFVAMTGSNRAAGTLQAPFQTIQRAASVAKPGDLVLIEGGTYHETVTPVRSGTTAKPITFAAYENQTVVIDGADPITGWSSNMGAIYQASMRWTMGSGKDQVFVDGHAMNQARWPASGLDLSHPTFAHADNVTTSIADGTNASTATLTDSALTQPAGFWDGATIRFSPGQGWALQTGTVTDSSPGSLTFTFTSDIPTRPYTIPTAGNAYSVIGTFNALSGAGEFYRNSNGTLYLRTPSEDDPGGHNVEAQRRQYGFNLNGRSDVHLVALTFFADTIETDGNSHGLLMDGITIQYPQQFTTVTDPWTVADDPAYSALVLFGSGNDIKDSTLEFAPGNGVLLAGSNNTVQGCTIHDANYTGGDFAAITTAGSSGKIYDNTVFNTGRNGILLSSAAGVQVVNNVVHDAMLQTTDGGGIYSFGTNGTGSLIADNQVYNIRSGGYGAAGIYLDNGDSNWTVQDNTVWNCNHALKLNPPNSNDLIESNVLANSDDMVGTSGSGAMPGTVFQNNTATGVINVGSGATQINNSTSATFDDPSDPAPNANLAAGHGSFTPVPNPGAAIAADEQKLQSDLTALTGDTAARVQSLAADKAVIARDIAAAAAALKNDRSAGHATLAAAAISSRQTAVADRQSIAADRVRLKSDRGNDSALAVDQAQLAADLAKLVSDQSSSKVTLRTDAATAKATIASDQRRIRLLHSASSPAAMKLKADETSWAQRLLADKQAITADKKQLAQDERA